MPVFHTEEGFPGCINTSINDAAVHGVPGKQKLKIGDLLSIDAGMILDGYCGDSTITVPIGKVSPQHQYLLDTTREAMMAGIRAAMPGKHIGDIGYARLVITIEPILVEKSPRVQVDVDGWTVRTVDGGWTAQFEHTVMLTRQGAVILSAA